MSEAGRAGGRRLALLLITGALLAGCGSSSTQSNSTTASTTSATTSVVKLATVQGCLQKDGYVVRSGAAKAISKSGASEEMGVDLEAGAGKKGTPRKREGVLVAERAGGSQGEATIVVFLAPKEAEESAAEARSVSEGKSRAGSQETPAKEGVLVASRGSAAWIAWTNASLTSQQIAGCVS